MRRTIVALVLCACAYSAAGGLAKLAGKLRHNKRGVLSSVPTFKLGHDIPHVTHSVVKPFVVSYPPTAAVTAVKVPLAHPLLPRYPLPVGHRVPVPHPHYGLRFPHHTKSVVLPKPDQHFHHHHHHVAPRPVVPVVPAPPVPATPVLPLQPSGTVAIPSFPAPPPPLIARPPVPAPVFPVGPPPLQTLPPHLTPVVPAPIPLQPAPVFPVAPSYPYVIRPGNAIQSSLFATYPRYPLVSYQQLLPVAAPVAPSVGPVFLNRPQVAQFPHFHATASEGFAPHPTHPVALEPTPSVLHTTQAAVPPTQPVPLDHNGWAPVPTQPHDIVPTQAEGHFPQQHPHFTQEQGTQVYEHHSGSDEQQFHEYQHQLHHIQQQIDQAQYEQHLNNQHQLNQEYGAPQQVSQEYGQPTQGFSQQQGFNQHDYNHQDFNQHDFSQHDYNQQAQDHYNLQQQQQQQLGNEYGVPQQEGEGRSLEVEGEEQRYHNHIPLGLQLPMEQPLDHFR